jgi:hypothetical protein
VANVAVAAKVGIHLIEIMDSEVKVNGTVLAAGSTKLLGDVIVESTGSYWVIRGPHNEHNERAILWGYRAGWDNAVLPTGYFYNTYAILPHSHSDLATGLCQSTISAGTAIISVTASLFSIEAQNAIRQQCYCGNQQYTLTPECHGSCPDGQSWPCHENPCSPAGPFESREEYMQCTCEWKGRSFADAAQACNFSACPSQYEACILDYCLVGGVSKVPGLYLEEKTNVCALGCASCDMIGGVCSACSDSCNTHCTFPAESQLTIDSGFGSGSGSYSTGSGSGLDQDSPEPTASEPTIIPANSGSGEDINQWNESEYGSDVDSEWDTNLPTESPTQSQIEDSGFDMEIPSESPTQSFDPITSPPTLQTPTPSITQVLDWSSNYSYSFTLSTLHVSNFDPSTTEGRVVRTAFRDAVAHTASVASNEVVLHVSALVKTPERRETEGVKIDIQIARAPPADFESKMVSPEHFATEFVARAKAQGVEIDPPELHRLQTESNQEAQTETATSDSLVWPLVGGAVGVLA